MAGTDRNVLVADSIKNTAGGESLSTVRRCVHIHTNETEVPFLSVKPMLNLSLVSAEHQIAAVGTELYAVACGLVESALATSCPYAYEFHFQFRCFPILLQEKLIC